MTSSAVTYKKLYCPIVRSSEAYTYVLIIVSTTPTVSHAAQSNKPGLGYLEIAVTRSNDIGFQSTYNELGVQQISLTSLPREVISSHQKLQPMETNMDVAAEIAVWVTGCWTYFEPPAHVTRRDWSYARIEFWDSGGALPNTRLGVTYADQSGCFEGEVLSSETDRADIFVRAYTRDDHSVWVATSIGVQDTNLSTTYFGDTMIYYNVTSSTLDVGQWAVNPNLSNSAAVYIYDLIADQAWDYLEASVGWDNNFNLPVQWRYGSPDTTGYLPKTDDPGIAWGILLASGDRWDHDVILHEYGHFVMDMTYEIFSPAHCPFGIHIPMVPTTKECAWQEGWADFLQGAIQNDRYYIDTENANVNFDMESVSLIVPGTGQFLEGAIAASLWDIFDNRSESWDSIANDINGASNNGIWQIFFYNDPVDILQFERGWLNSNNGYNDQVKAIFSHHGINIPTPPGAFSKSSPANGTTNQRTSLTLSWGASPGATSYAYCYDTTNDNACSNWTSNGAATSKAITGLSPNTTYYWHVRAFNAYDVTFANGSATAFWSFRTSSGPGAFSKSSPANGATNQSTSLTLTWGVSNGASTYAYCYDTTNDNACSNWTSNGAATSRVLSGLSPNTTYYWHVRAFNAYDVTFANGSSTAFWSFRTGGAPSAFSKSSPANGATNQPTSLTLTWGASPGATSYAYCYDTTNDNACSNWTSNGAATSKSITGLSSNTTYYWHVRAFNSSGVAFANGSSTAFWSFRTR